MNSEKSISELRTIIDRTCICDQKVSAYEYNCILLPRAHFLIVRRAHIENIRPYGRITYTLYWEVGWPIVWPAYTRAAAKLIDVEFSSGTLKLSRQAGKILARSLLELQRGRPPIRHRISDNRQTAIGILVCPQTFSHTVMCKVYLPNSLTYAIRCGRICTAKSLNYFWRMRILVMSPH